MSILRAPLQSLNKVLIFSILTVYLLLFIIPAYLAVRRMTQPIRQMRDVALSMARGDFSARADEDSRGESANWRMRSYLAERLGDTARADGRAQPAAAGVLDGLAEEHPGHQRAGRDHAHQPAMYELFDTRRGAFDALREALRQER